MSAKNQILAAFRDLVLAERFDELRTRDIIERAGVARSTFYAHFSGKNELLIESLGPILRVLADCCRGTASEQALRETLEHLWANRHVGRVFFQPPMSPLLVRALARMLDDGTGDPVYMHYTINGLVGILGAWVLGDFAMGPCELARALPPTVSHGAP